MTRGQFASLLARAFPHLAPNDADDYYSDDGDSVHEAAINALAAAGIATGCGPGSFCPADPIRRDHTAAMLARALPGPGPTGPDYFSDDDGSVHEAAINALAAAGIATGCGPGSFCPADPIRRDHTAAMLARALGLEPDEIEPAPWRLELVADGIDGSPTDLQAPVGDDRAFLTTKQGEILLIADDAVSPEPFLDLTHKVRTRGEQGLLGLAFHPDYAANGELYVFYNGLDGHSHLYQYQTDPQNPDRADPATARRIITIEQNSPNGYHMGGQLQFGPDGYLYIAVGDSNRGENGQNTRNLLGTILRIDVDNGDPYAIPANNPYADGQDGQPEIWAHGLRNPWRFSFDGPHIYIADVGADFLEEINIADASTGGINYGWNTLEGTRCRAQVSDCDTAGLFNPQIHYSQTEGTAVIGGYVYRGDAIGEMTGRYFYSDFTGGWIRTLAYRNGQITQHRQLPQPDLDRVHSFGTDGHGELYLLTETAVHKIVPYSFVNGDTSNLIYPATGKIQISFDRSDLHSDLITHYQYKLRRLKRDKEYGPWINILTSEVSATGYTITGLSIDTAYNIGFRACSFTGCGRVTVVFQVRSCATAECEPVEVLAFAPVFTPTVLPHPGFWFSDDDGSVHEADIEALAAAGVTRGCRRHLYCPDEELTRGQFASLLARAFPHLVPADAKDRFGDDDSSVHEAAINALAAAGIADGCEPGRFCPADPIRRDHTAAMLARALPGPAPDNAYDYFSDDDGSVHETAINALAAAGIADGCEPGRFCPADPIRRDQTATMLAPALGLEPAPIEPVPWRLELVADGIDGGPTDLQAPAGDDRAFVTTKQGEILLIADDAVSPEPFLDLTHKVRTRGEQGLLGLAFHPDYAANGELYVFYTGLDGHSHLYEYQADPQNPDRADPATARRIITIEQEGVDHKGGQLQFGPDGYLYIAVGDDYRGEDGQNTRTLLGTILRIDIDNGDPYAVPADNPYADGQDGRPEIWAHGLRNPWRFSFDGPHIYIADVGSYLLEEINIADASTGGINYGWNTLEGTHCHSQISDCDTAGLFNPQIQYPRREGNGVIGGYVYRGDAIGEMTGRYFYSDYTGGWIRTFLYDNGEITQHRQWLQTTTPPSPGLVHSFGTDGRGELYLLTENAVHKIVPPTVSSSP